MTTQTSRPGILIVDDEPRILDSLRDILEDDYCVFSTTDPLEALGMLKDLQVAVILADQRMPQLTGDEFLTRAQEISEAARVLITGYADISALIRAVNDGKILTYVAKPWEPLDLRDTVSKAAKYSEEMARRKAAAERVAEQQEALARSEATLRHQTKLLQSILDSMGDGVLVTDETGRLVLMNPAAEQMVGLSRHDAAQGERMKLEGLYKPGTDTLYTVDELPLTRAMRGETVDGIEMFVRNNFQPQGIHVSVNVRPLRDDDGRGRGGVGVIRDITKAKAAEDLLRIAMHEAESANRAKSEFLSRMSHELRTPLNSILGFAQLLQLEDLSEVNQDNVQHILKGGYHLLGLINEVLDLARIEAGRLSLSLEPVQISEVLKDAFDIVAPLAQQQNVKLHAMESPCFEYVMADRQRLKQVLLNLLANAVKFNREGGSVFVESEIVPGERLRITVCDTGRGISQAGLKKIFTPFERLGADEAGIGGTGLGLLLSKRLVEAMEATITVESEVFKGSRFSLEFPLTSNPVGAIDTEKRSADANLDDSTTFEGVLLYIEDNPANVALIERVLARYPGVKLWVAMRGKMGLEIAKAHRPDWILLDLCLPDLSGEEVLRELQSDPRTSAIPVTVASAEVMPHQIHQLLEIGAREFLTKPLDIKQIIALLEATMPRNAKCAR